MHKTSWENGSKILGIERILSNNKIYFDFNRWKVLYPPLNRIVLKCFIYNEFILHFEKFQITITCSQLWLIKCKKYRLMLLATTEFLALLLIRSIKKHQLNILNKTAGGTFYQWLAGWQVDWVNTLRWPLKIGRDNTFLQTILVFVGQIGV